MAKGKKETPKETKGHKDTKDTKDTKGTKENKKTKDENVKESKKTKKEESDDEQNDENENSGSENETKGKKGLKKNARTTLANCTLNVNMLNKYCQTYLKNYCPHDKDIKTPNLDVAVGPCCETLFEYLVKGASSYAQKNNVVVEHKGKEVGKVNQYSVTLSCVRQAVDADDYLAEALGSTAKRFDHVSRDNTSHFLNQTSAVVDAYVESVLKSSQVNFDKEALNLICHLVETALTKMLVIANAFRDFMGRNTVGFKHFQHAAKLYFKGTLLSNIQLRLDEVENKLESNKVSRSDDSGKKGKGSKSKSKSKGKGKGKGKAKSKEKEKSKSNSDSNSDSDSDSESESEEKTGSDSESESDASDSE
jgi:hypothetical protein